MKTTATDTTAATLELLAGRGGLLALPPGSKAPPPRGWNQAPPLSVEAALAHARAGGNLGVRADALLVVDVDAKGLARLEDVGDSYSLNLPGGRIDLPETWCAETPSRGVHIYFRKPEGLELGNTQGTLAAGIDTRSGAAGYVVIPHQAVTESVTPGRPAVHLSRWRWRMLLGPLSSPW